MTEHLDRFEQRYGHIEGPTEEEQRAAEERFRERRRAMQDMHASGQGNLPRFIGTPRRAKHRGGRIGGVPIK